jgi:hypothetical protein
MLYGGTNAILRENNWDNPINVDPSAGVSGDFSGSYFGGLPVNQPTANQNG